MEAWRRGGLYYSYAACLDSAQIRGGRRTVSRGEGGRGSAVAVNVTAPPQHGFAIPELQAVS